MEHFLFPSLGPSYGDLQYECSPAQNLLVKNYPRALKHPSTYKPSDLQTTGNPHSCPGALKKGARVFHVPAESPFYPSPHPGVQ
ncbi:hypothetical protein CEXT_794981 [Caerostris extrusa]|uniref:Uncharacterized protein n=1 Tax=Caerostris extrusa TaxID=172846 RepID=A0AAV4TC58_CAEEX|nr:hypothetical protein CEXT_794981 [Caerostris extrusa]